jgi:hypothetical protein
MSSMPSDLVPPRSVRVPTSIVSGLFLERVIGRAARPKDGSWIVPIEDIVMAKDYVTSLTDTQAKTLHQELPGWNMS